MINLLELTFPEGIEMEDAQKIAQVAELITNFGVSQGGYKMLTNPFYADEEGIKFSENVAEFVLSYKRKVKHKGKE